jgi:hypothetical protein
MNIHEDGFFADFVVLLKEETILKPVQPGFNLVDGHL